LSRPVVEFCSGGATRPHGSAFKSHCRPRQRQTTGNLYRGGCALLRLLAIQYCRSALMQQEVGAISFSLEGGLASFANERAGGRPGLRRQGKGGHPITSQWPAGRGTLTRRVPLGKPRSIFGRNQVGHSQPARIAVPLEPGNALETRDMLIEDFNTRATEQ
jgi:hypothetical protein